MEDSPFHALASFLLVSSQLRPVLCVSQQRRIWVLLDHTSFLLCHCAGRVLLAALLYGFVVHFRVFPIIYALSFFLSLAPAPDSSVVPDAAATDPSVTQEPLKSSTSDQQRRQNSSQKPDPAPGRGGLFGWISVAGVAFGAVSASVFFLLTGLFYRMYGMEFLHEALLYHASRTDHRHNFSIYFYGIYLVSHHS